MSLPYDISNRRAAGPPVFSWVVDKLQFDAAKPQLTMNNGQLTVKVSLRDIL